nr:membrane protein, putative [Babesia bovis]
MLRIALSVLTAESVMKLGLRAWFYGRNVNWVSMIPNGVYSVGGSISQKFAFLPRALNALGTGVFGGYWSGESLSGLIHFIVHSAVIARLAFITAIQHALFRENFHTASFILSPLASKLASVVTGIVCAIATAGNLGTMFIFKNFANAVDVEHLLDQSSFRATESQAAATGYVRNAIHNIPKLLKSANLDIVVQLTYYHDYLVRLVPRGIEWPILLFHLSLALYANSAAGLYLALVNAVYSVINQRLSSYERSIVTRDIDEIVQESG